MKAQTADDVSLCILADWHDDQGDSRTADMLREGVSESPDVPWTYESKWGSVGGGVGGGGGSVGGGVGGGGGSVGGGVGGGSGGVGGVGGGGGSGSVGGGGGGGVGGVGGG